MLAIRVLCTVNLIALQEHLKDLSQMKLSCPHCSCPSLAELKLFRPLQELCLYIVACPGTQVREIPSGYARTKSVHVWVHSVQIFFSSSA